MTAPEATRRLVAVALGITVGVALVLTRTNTGSDAPPAPGGTVPAPTAAGLVPSSGTDNAGKASKADAVVMSVRERSPSPNTWWTLALRNPIDTSVTPPANCPDLYSWARRRQAAPIGEAEVTLEVRARRPVRIRLDQVVGRLVGTPRESGVALLLCDETGRYDAASYDHDDARPKMLLGRRPDAVAPEPDDDSERPLKAGESYQFDFSVIAAGGPVDSRYVLDAAITVDGRKLSSTIDDDGQPFIILSIPDGVGYSPPTYTFQAWPSTHLEFHPASS